MGIISALFKKRENSDAPYYVIHRYNDLPVKWIRYYPKWACDVVVLGIDFGHGKACVASSLDQYGYVDLGKLKEANTTPESFDKNHICSVDDIARHFLFRLGVPVRCLDCYNICDGDYNDWTGCQRCDQSIESHDIVDGWGVYDD